MVLEHPGLGTDFVFVAAVEDSRPHLREGLLEQFDIRAVHAPDPAGLGVLNEPAPVGHPAFDIGIGHAPVDGLPGIPAILRRLKPWIVVERHRLHAVHHQALHEAANNLGIGVPGVPPLGVWGRGEQTRQHDVAGVVVGHVGVSALDALKQREVLGVEQPTFHAGDGGRRGIVFGIGPVDVLLGLRHVLIRERSQSSGVDALGDFQVFKAVLEAEVEATHPFDGLALEVEHVAAPAVMGHQPGGAVNLPQLVPPAHRRGVVGLQMRLGAGGVGLVPAVADRPGVVIEQEQMLAVGLGHQSFQAAVLGR